MWFWSPTSATLTSYAFANQGEPFGLDSTLTGFLLAAKISLSQLKSDKILGQLKSQLKSEIFA